MRPPTPQPRMPDLRFRFFGIVLIAAITFLILLRILGILDRSQARSALVSLGVALVMVAAVELLLELGRRFGEYSQRGHFREVFGDAAFEKEGVRLIFACRKIKRGLATDPWDTHYQPTTEDGEPVPEGVNTWLAFQDVRAASYLSSAIFQMTGQQAIFIHDKNVEQDPKYYCAISIGLGFNSITHQMAGYFHPPLFKVEWGASPKNPNLFTDLLSIGGDKGGNVDIPVDEDVAIVARIVPRPPELGLRNRVWFVCAGRTAAGTAAAGYFLARDWGKILNLYRSAKKDLLKDSVAILIRHNEYKKDRSASAEFEFDDTAEMYKVKGEPILCWGRVAGIEQEAPTQQSSGR